MAWLHAVPKAPEKKQVKPKEGSRLATLKEQGREPRLPEAALKYLVDYLLEVGPTEQGGFGPKPLSHVELMAWQINMHRRLQPYEVDFLRRLSVTWCVESQRAQDPVALPPYAAEMTEDDHMAVARAMKQAIRERLQ